MKKYSFNLSRLIKHLEDNSFGIISGYLGKLSLKENKERHKKLKSLVRSKGYGYKEIKGFWEGEETKKLEEEYALFIPKITFEDIKSLGKEFEQEAIIFGEEGKIILYSPLTNTTLKVFKTIQTNPDDSWKEFLKVKNKSLKLSSWYMEMPPEKNSFMNSLVIEAWKDFSKACDLPNEIDKLITTTLKVKAKIS